MKRAAAALMVALVLAVAVVGYYYTAWSTAHAAAVSIAAGDPNAFVVGSTWALGAALPHDRLQVRTLGGWIEMATDLTFPFTISDAATHRTVSFSVDVAFDFHGWHVVGMGDLGG